MISQNSITVDSDGKTKLQVSHTAHHFGDVGSAVIHGWLDRLLPSFALTSASHNDLIQKHACLIQNLLRCLLSRHSNFSKSFECQAECDRIDGVKRLAELRDKYDLHMTVERFASDEYKSDEKYLRN